MRPIKPLKEDFAENWNWNVGWKQTLKKLFGSLAGVRWEMCFSHKVVISKIKENLMHKMFYCK